MASCFQYWCPLFCLSRYCSGYNFWSYVQVGNADVRVLLKTLDSGSNLTPFSVMVLVVIIGPLLCWDTTLPYLIFWDFYQEKCWYFSNLLLTHWDSSAVCCMASLLSCVMAWTRCTHSYNLGLIHLLDICVWNWSLLERPRALGRQIPVLGPSLLSPFPNCYKVSSFLSPGYFSEERPAKLSRTETASHQVLSCFNCGCQAFPF